MGWSSWLQSMLRPAPVDAGGAVGPGYQRIASRVLDHASVRPGDTLVDVGTGTGLLAFAAAPLVGSGGCIVAVDADADCLRRCRDHAARESPPNMTFVQGRAEAMPIRDGSADVVVCRSVLCHIVDKRSVLREWYRILRTGGRFSCFEPIDRYETRFSDLVDFGPLGEIAARLRRAEEAMHHDPHNSLMNFDEEGLQRILHETGFQDVEHRLVERSREYAMTAASAREWWHKDIGGIALPAHPSPYQILQRYLATEQLDACVGLFCASLNDKTIVFHSKQLYIWGRK